MLDVIVREGTERDLPPVLDLLAAAQLPTQGVAALQHRGRLLVASNDSHIVACAGVEDYGRQAILRSVVVHRDARRGGLGRRIVEAAIVFAELEGHAELLLLTENAARFFQGPEFEHVDRAAVAGAVRQSAEFRFLCPESASVMRRALGPTRRLEVLRG